MINFLFGMCFCLSLLTIIDWVQRLMDSNRRSDRYVSYGDYYRPRNFIPDSAYMRYKISRIESRLAIIEKAFKTDIDDMDEDEEADDE